MKKIASLLVLFVVVVLAACSFNSESVQGFMKFDNSKKPITVTCPDVPKAVFSGTALISEPPRGFYSFTITTGDFDTVKSYVKNGCQTRVVLTSSNSLGYEYSNAFECQSMLTYGSFFECHYGQSVQTFAQTNNDSVENENFADTFIGVKQEGDNAFVLNIAGWKQDANDQDGFTPHAFIGSPVSNSLKVFVSR